LRSNSYDLVSGENIDLSKFSELTSI